jgi:hypothetical protein
LALASILSATKDRSKSQAGESMDLLDGVCFGKEGSVKLVLFYLLFTKQDVQKIGNHPEQMDRRTEKILN